MTTAEAVKLQEKLRGRVIKKTTFKNPSTVGGVDVSVKDGISRAAVAVLTYPGQELVNTVTASRPTEFPYVPGLLAFREIPVILDAFEKLTDVPDFLIVDGQGYAHPRRFGVACHLGVELDIPAIGCAKSRLIGEYEEPGVKRGARSALYYEKEVIGSVVRTRDGVKPVFISIGHRVDLDTAVSLALGCVTRYRLPEPVREAHKAAGL